MAAPPRRRAGAVLILVAGIAALLISMALAFLTRMRGDAEESLLTIRETQARLMLSAACNFILEAGRLGWETPAAPGVPSPHEEAFGWIDVRDGRDGPWINSRTGTGSMLTVATVRPGNYAGTWVDLSLPPAQRPAGRFPMFVMERPPYATRLDAVYNPIATTGAAAGLPYLVNPDPQPVQDNGWNAAAQTLTPPSNAFALYQQGLTQPRIHTLNRAWFRIFRDGPATFVVTCGSGGTMGYRLKDWNAVDAHGVPLVDHQLFAGDYETFRDMDANETRYFYRVEWSAAVLSLDYHNLDHELDNRDLYMSWPPNASHTWRHSIRTQLHAKNALGTISWVQRLVVEPSIW